MDEPRSMESGGDVIGDLKLRNEFFVEDEPVDSEHDDDGETETEIAYDHAKLSAKIFREANGAGDEGDDASTEKEDAAEEGGVRLRIAGEIAQRVRIPSHRLQLFFFARQDFGQQRLVLPEHHLIPEFRFVVRIIP